MKSLWFGDYLLRSGVSSCLSSGGGSSAGGSLPEGKQGFCRLSSQGVGSFLLLSCQHPVVELSPRSVTCTLQDLVHLLSGDAVGSSCCCCCLSPELLGWFTDSSAVIRFSVNFQLPGFRVKFITVFITATHIVHSSSGCRLRRHGRGEG